MITILLDTLAKFQFNRIVLVIGHKGEMVQETTKNYRVQYAWQKEQNGTGHAVMMTQHLMTHFEGTTLVAAGDVPFLSRDSISQLFEMHQRTGAAATCLSAIFPDPKGYGRIIRVPGTDRLQAIVEHKDATEEQRLITEVNSGTFCFDNKKLFEVINEIGNENSQGEYYLTDAVKLLHDKGLVVSVVTASDPDEVRGVNSVEQLEELAQRYSHRF